MSGPKDAGSASQGPADRSALLASIKGRLADDAFQVAGDQLLFVLAEDVPGAADMARQCAQVLRERGWDGDPELAEQIEAALGQGPVPALRPLPVNLADLSELLEADLDQRGGGIDVETGEVWPRSTMEDAWEEGEPPLPEADSDRWLPVEPEGPRDGYRDMERFIATVEDPLKAGFLEQVITGRGAFRRFRDALRVWPDESENWWAFSGERRRGRARAWLAASGYTPR